jgi:hypothetical protein
LCLGVNDAYANFDKKKTSDSNKYSIWWIDSTNWLRQLCPSVAIKQEYYILSCCIGISIGTISVKQHSTLLCQYHTVVEACCQLYMKYLCFNTTLGHERLQKSFDGNNWNKCDLLCG